MNDSIINNDEYPEIWIKTHPQGKETKRVELHLTSFSQNPDVPRQLKNLYSQLLDHVKLHGGKILSKNPLL